MEQEGGVHVAQKPCNGVGNISLHAFAKGAFGLGSSRAYVAARRHFESGPVTPSARTWCGWLETSCDMASDQIS